MPITVKHLKVSTVPDAGDDTLVEPSDWNADHQLIGLGTMAEQNANNVAITGGTMSGVTVTGYIPTTEKGAALGVATLDAGGKVPQSQIPLMGDLNYQGTWNASTNTPTLTSSVGTKGYYYVVDVSGNTNLNGITDWVIGDWAIFNGSIWQKVDNTDAVVSVNGQTGVVVLTTTNIAEGTNEYFTQARARTSISAGTGISYDNTTGVVTNAAPDQVVALTGAGTTTISGTYPNFTITSNDEFDGNVVGPASATDNAIARFDGTTGKLLQNSIVTVSDTGVVTGVIEENFTPITPPTYLEGKVFYDTDAKTLAYYNDNSQMTVNIGQEQIVRVRNQTGATIDNGTVVYVNGATGNTPTIAKAIATSFTTSDIIGVTTTTIANNGFGYVTISGLVNGLDTSAFAEGDAVFLSATTAGTYTVTEPTRPNYSIQVGVILRANPSVGTLLVSVQIVSTETTHIIGTVAVDQGGTGQTTYTDGQLLIGNSTGNTLTKSTLTAGTAISVTNGAGAITIANTGVTQATAGTGISVSASTGNVTITNTAPDQTVSITGGTGISTSGTYPNFTVTNTAPDQVVALTGAGTTTVTGTYPNFTITSNDSTLGTVTSVAALTLGTTGTDLSSTVANSTTTPVITLNVPTASSVNRGALSSTDWTTFNNKAPAVTYTTNYVPYGQGTTTPNQSASFTYTTGTGALRVPAVEASNGLVVNNMTIATSYSIPSGYAASSVGPVVVSSGVTITVPSGSRWVVL